jgi:serine/threonine-protein kinase
MVPMLHDPAGRRRTAFFRQIAAEASAFAGHHEETLSCLAQSIESGLIDLVWLDHCPLLERARQDTRFYTLRVRVQARAAAVGRAFGNT